MQVFIPDKRLQRDIPHLDRETAIAHIRRFESVYPGPYSLEGVEPFPAETYGFAPGTYFAYTPNRFRLVGRMKPRPKTHLFKHIEDVYDEVRGHFSAMKMMRLKVYVLDGRGVRVLVDSQVMEKARRIIIPAGGAT